jgi:HB1, ASXL, restriction endonuclease HTH domain
VVTVTTLPLLAFEFNPVKGLCVNTFYLRGSHMDTPKLIEALDELKAKRETLDSAIAHLEKAIQVLSGSIANHIAADIPKAPPAIPQGTPFAMPTKVSRSYIDDAELMLQQVGTPLHARDLSARISELRGREIPRASMESTIIRHIADLKERARITKVGASTYGLPSWTVVPIQEVLDTAS